MNARPKRPSAFAYKPRAKPMQHEHYEQAAVVRWLEFKRIPFFAVPNAARRSPRTAAMLKAQGMRAGVPDLILPKAPYGKFDITGVAVEMKRASGGRVSPEQAEWIALLESCGWRCIVAKGAEHAIRELEGLGY